MKIITNTNNFNKTSTAVTFKGIYNNKMLLKGLGFAADNGALFCATFAFGLSAVARPISILATPKTDKENKKYACAKSFASSLSGYLVMFCASLPVAKAVKKINENPKNYLKPATIKTLKNGSKSLNQSKAYMFATQLFKLGVGLIVAIPKSVLTCALIPPIMAMIFHKKDNSATPPQKPEKKATSNVISFKGIYNAATESLAKGIGKVIDSSSVQKTAKRFYDANISQHIMSLTDVILTLSFVHQTKKNKNIEESRKKPLIHNSLISTGLCLTGGYAVNSALKKPAEKFIKKFSEVNKDLPNLAKYVEGIKIAKPTLILGGIYYIIIPIVSTFLSDKTGSKKQT